MRDYDPTMPLIFIHVPKTAGTSVRSVFEGWFPGRAHRHYYHWAQQKVPERIELAAHHAPGAAPLIVGHFNRDRGLGVEDYYPQVRQFVTLLRDPLAMHISRFYFKQRRVADGHTVRDFDHPVFDDHIRHDPLNMLVHFPRVMTPANYRDILEEYFIDIGLVEDLAASMARIAARLGRTMPEQGIPHVNKSRAPDPIPADTRQMFREKWPLEHMIYDYAVERHRQAMAAGKV